MSRFIVKFLKDVLGCNGRQAEICQRMLEVEAPDESHAADVAKKRFCEQEQLKNWSLHADRFRIEAASRRS